MSTQQQMAQPPKTHRNHDYINLFPPGVYPTGDVDVLERGHNLLIVKSYDFSRKEIPNAHRVIWNTLVTLGELDGARGHVTVICVWGLGETHREYVRFDHMGESGRYAVNLEQWRQILRAWWTDNRKFR